MKIIDCHGHVSAPAELWAYKAIAVSRRGSHGRGGPQVLRRPDPPRGREEAVRGRDSHMDSLNKIGTDVQAISPRPFQIMHSEKPAKIVQWFQEEVNNVIHRQTQLYPDRFFGVAGLPQPAGEPLDMAITELERCVKELGFKGCLLNPDPYENSGAKAPPLGDRYWYPLYEKLCELDVPAHIHAHRLALPGARALHAALHQRGDDRRLRPRQLRGVQRFPDPEDHLQPRRRRDARTSSAASRRHHHARRARRSVRRAKLFSEAMKKLYYDTVLYTEEAIDC